MLRPRSTTAIVAAAFVFLVLLAAPVLAYEEPNSQGGSGACDYCHDVHGGSFIPDMDCESCHGSPDTSEAPGYDQGLFEGPHGAYTSSTAKCDNCHTVHAAPAGGIALLPATTIVLTCFTCHDGTAGYGVYGAIKQQTGVDPAGGHSYEATSMIPGGNAVTGGEAARTFNGPDDTLICTDCHSPHGANTVDPFEGDRRRVRVEHPPITSDRLLKQRPTGAVTTVTAYGSDWCIACHAGRSSGGAVHNHPVDSTATTATPFTYGNVAALASDEPTAVTVLDTLGGLPGVGVAHGGWPVDLDPPGNRGFLMPYPRTAQQSGHNPICQQCHEDSREVGELTGGGSVGDAATATASTADKVTWSGGWVDSPNDNPAFQNFPHESQNDYMLVETDDDLCTNCHPVAQLP